MEEKIFRQILSGRKDRTHSIQDSFGIKFDIIDIKGINLISSSCILYYTCNSGISTVIFEFIEKKYRNDFT